MNRTGLILKFMMKPIQRINVTHSMKIDLTYKLLSSVRNTFASIHRYRCDNHTLLSSDVIVPRSAEESQEVLNILSPSPSDSKLLKIAIIGVPNSGKSTLINQLVQWNVCSISQKVHTTLCNARAIKNIGSTQLVFLDTPGLVTNEEVKKYRLVNSIVHDPEVSLQHADCIGVLQDISNKHTQDILHPKVMRLLALYPTIPSVLILNKVDLLGNKDFLLKITTKLTDGTIGNKKMTIHKSRGKFKNIDDYELKEKLIKKYLNRPIGDKPLSELSKKQCSSDVSFVDSDVVFTSSYFENSDDKPDLYKDDPIDTSFTPEDVYSGKIRLTENQLQHFIKDRQNWPKFEEVFMISAKDGTGIDAVRTYFESIARPNKWIFSTNVITDQSPQEIAKAAVRASCLEHLANNIPYELKYEILYWDLNEADYLSILVGAYCKTKSHLKLLIGRNGIKVAQIAKGAEQELRNTFRTDVRVRINFEYHPVKNKS